MFLTSSIQVTGGFPVQIYSKAKNFTFATLLYTNVVKHFCASLAWLWCLQSFERKI